LEKTDLKILRSLEDELKLKIFSNEFRIVSELYQRGPTESLRLRELTKNSISAHNIYLKRLYEKNIIDFVRDKSDKRKKLYKISDDFNDSIIFKYF
jgi:DNA-binding MarR family transcriptional regulator